MQASLHLMMSDSENNFDKVDGDASQPSVIIEPEDNEDTGRLMIVNASIHSKKRRTRILACLLVTVAISLVMVVLIALLSVLSVMRRSPRAGALPSDPHERALALLTDYPLIDGHNDLPFAIRYYYDNQFEDFDLTTNGSAHPSGASWHTDIPRLRAGKVGGQFWSAYMGCSTQGLDATRTFIDQIDVIKLLVKKYPDTFQFATSSSDIASALKSNRIASLVGVEGGHAIDSSLGTLRQLYDLGARYMTLTHVCNTPWAHNSYDNSTKGLTEFGRRVVREMNRLGMLVDISHVNNYTMMDVLDTSVAPVIFSHSSSYAVCPHPRNVPDNILMKLKANNGVVMVTFFPSYVNCTDPEGATLEQVADHIEYIKQTIGVNHVGIGSDFGGTRLVPKGLEDVSRYPSLFAELIRRGFSDDDVKKISRFNLIRVLQDVEKTSSKMKGQFPDNTLISPQPNGTCRPDF